MPTPIDKAESIERLRALPQVRRWRLPMPVRRSQTSRRAAATAVPSSTMVSRSS